MQEQRGLERTEVQLFEETVPLVQGEQPALISRESWISVSQKWQKEGVERPSQETCGSLFHFGTLPSG